MKRIIIIVFIFFITNISYAQTIKIFYNDTGEIIAFGKDILSVSNANNIKTVTDNNIINKLFSHIHMKVVNNEIVTDTEYYNKLRTLYITGDTQIKANEIDTAIYTITSKDYYGNVSNDTVSVNIENTAGSIDKISVNLVNGQGTFVLTSSKQTVYCNLTVSVNNKYYTPATERVRFVP